MVKGDGSQGNAEGPMEIQLRSRETPRLVEQPCRYPGPPHRFDVEPPASSRGPHPKNPSRHSRFLLELERHQAEVRQLRKVVRAPTLIVCR